MPSLGLPTSSQVRTCPGRIKGLGLNWLVLRLRLRTGPIAGLTALLSPAGGRVALRFRRTRDRLRHGRGGDTAGIRWLWDWLRDWGRADSGRAAQGNMRDGLGDGANLLGT